MAKKIRLGYDILSKRAIETASGVNIDDALRRKDQQIADINTSITNIEGDIADIQAVIPDDASSDNQLITVDGVDQKIADVLSNSDLIYLDASNGNDENDGLTRNKAVKTISGAIQAFNAANSERRRLTTLKVMILTTTSASHQLPTDEEVASAYPAGYYQPEIYLYSAIDTTLVISNATVGAPVMTSYAIHVMSKYVSLNLVPNQTQFCSSLVYVDAESIYGNYYTTGRQELNASDGVYISSGVLEASEYKPTLIIKSGGSVNLSGPEYWYQILSIEANGAVNVNQRVHPTYSDVSIISHQSSVYIQDGIISANQNVTIRAKGYVTLNNIDCLDLTIESDDQVDVRAAINVYGSTNIKCSSFSPSNASNGYHGNLTVIASESIYLLSSGTFYIAGRAVFEAGTTYAGPPNMYVTQMVVKAGRINGNDGISYSYSIHPYTNDDKFYDEKSESSYIFDIGCAKFYSRYSNIENKYADVTIKSSGKVYISDDYPLNVKSLTLTCGDLSILSPLNVGFFNIDVANMIEMQSPTSNIYMLINAGDSSTSDYVSYDNYSNNTLKCGSLYCSTRYSSSDGSYGLIHTHYGNAVKNIDIQVGMLLCPSYNTTGAQGTMTPQVLGKCESGGHTFNSTISGHVGGYVGYNGPGTINVSAWDHDIRQIPPSYGNVIIDPVPGSSNNINGVITLKFDDVYETNHFYFDPDQGDDTLDGCTRQTAVKTVTALVHAMMKKTGGSYNSSSNTFVISNPVSIHILSVAEGNNRQSTWFSSGANVYTLPDFMYDYSSTNPKEVGICFDRVNSYGGCRVQFNVLEFVPEAPDMSLYARAFNANVFIAKGFYTIGLVGYGNGEYGGMHCIEATGSVGIYNSSYYGGYSYYSSRLGPISIKARDIVLYGWFQNLTAKAENQLIIYDSCGGSTESDGNCCLYGITTLEGAGIQLGTGFQYRSGDNTYSNLWKIGIAGLAYIKSTGYINCYVDSMVHAVVYMEAADNIAGGFADGFFKGQFHAKCNSCTLGYNNNYYGSSYYSFNTYTATSNYGGAGIIDIQASRNISIYGWGGSGSDSYLYGVDIYLKAPLISGTSNLYIYGNNGQGKILIDADEMYFGFRPYYYGFVFIKAQHCTSTLRFYSGGSWTDGGGTTFVNLDIGKMRSSIELPTYVYTTSGSTRTYEITGRIGLMNRPVINWWNYSGTIDPDNPPTLDNVKYSFSIVVGNVTTEGHGIDKTGWVPDNSGTIIVLNDQKSLIAGQGINISDTGDNVVISSDPKSTIVECPVTISSGTATVQLTLNRYNVITGIDGTVTDLVIDFPVEATATLLTEVGFEFYLDGLAQDLNSVTFTNSTEQFSSAVPDEFTAGHIYQGVLVNRCITLVEYDRPDPDVMEINGKKYRIVKIGEQTWMAQNLADDTFGGIWYNNDTSNSLGYGKYYVESEARAISVPGWHFASENDWRNLISSLNGNSATKVASTSGWNGTQGTNESGLNILPAGYSWNPTSTAGDDTFMNVGLYGCFSYPDYNNIRPTEPWNPTISIQPGYNNDDISIDDNNMSYMNRYPVRLVKDMSVNIGGRDYKVVQIGNQLWMAENLDWKFNTLNFRDSSNNPLDTTTAIQAAYYNYDESTYGVNGNKYGLLYNWYAVDYLNQHLVELGIPDGWHVPTRSEYGTLAAGGSDAGTKLKSSTGWDNSGNGIDYYGFTAVPAGEWNSDFHYIGNHFYTWCSDINERFAYCFSLESDMSGSGISGNGTRYRTSSIRLVKNLI